MVFQTIQRDISKDIITGITITCLIFGASVYLPIIGFFCALFIPLPTLFYRSKLGRKTGIVIPIITILMMFAILGGVSIDILFFFELLLLGFVLSELMELNLSIEKTVLYACSSVIITGIVCLFFYSNFSNKGIYALVSEYVGTFSDAILVIYNMRGTDKNNLCHITSTSDAILVIF